MGCYTTSLTIRLHICSLLMAKSFCKLAAEQENSIWKNYISKQATSLKGLVEYYKFSYQRSTVPALPTFSR